MSTKNRTEEFSHRSRFLVQSSSAHEFFPEEKQLTSDEWHKEIGLVQGENSEKELLEFLQEVEDINGRLVDLASLIEEVKKHHKVILINTSEDSSLKKTLGRLMSDVQTTIRHLSSSLDKMKKKTDEMAAYGYNITTVHFKARKIHQGKLASRLLKLVAIYNEEQQRQTDACKKRIRKYAQLVEGEEVPDEKLESLISQGKMWPSGQILTDSLETKKIWDEVQARHEEIKQLEQSIQELHSLFQDLAMHVEQQGGVIDSIEHHIMETANYMVAANRKLREATRYKDRHRKKKCFCLSLLAVVLVGVILVIVFSVCSQGMCKK